MIALKKVAVAVVGAVASYYAAKWATKMLEEKPLKVRLHEGKEKVSDLQNAVIEKADHVKEGTRTKFGEVKDRLNRLFQDGE